MSIADNWHATADECAMALPSDGYLPPPVRHLHRAIDVRAPVAVTFRWLCQLSVAPYSYDLIDNWGRRSPRELTEGAGDLYVGKRFLIGPVEDWQPGRHISLRAAPEVARVYGEVGLTYAVLPAPVGSRILVRLTLGVSRTRWSRLRAELLAWGDLVMMRKQLLTLKALAERDSLP